MPLNPFPTSADQAPTQVILDELLATFVAAGATNLGFPAATRFDFAALAPFLNHMVNNLGDPGVDGAYPIHTKAQEREAVGIVADLLRAPVGDRWGYVTSGTSEGIEFALSMARDRYPQAIIYHSQAAHHCVAQAIDRLAMTSIVVRTSRRGEIDYDDLTELIGMHRDRPVIVVANIGTAITEAVDDVRRITTILDRLAITRRWVHADAAMSGIPLALCEPEQRPGFDFADGTDSIVVSGHKFLGSPIPYAVLVMRDSLRPGGLRAATYTGSPNTTLTNSRSGLAALILWYTLREHGAALRSRAQACRELADYTCRKLQDIGVGAWRHPLAFTVVMPTPPKSITGTWVLADHHGLSHVVCMPGVRHQDVDRFVHAMANATPRGDTTAVSVPRPRRSGDVRTPAPTPIG